MRTLLVLVSLVATACRYEGTYTCERNDQCRSASAAGTCQLPVGLCSFPDPMCPTTGQRYDDTAGSSSGLCVEPMMMIDASTAFDPNTCPTTFMQITADSPSRYRILAAPTSATTLTDQMMACTSQKAGATHPAIMETTAEATAVAAVVTGAGQVNQVMIGAIQDRAKSTPGEGWIFADGTPVPATLWASGEPNDGNGNETDHLEQVAVLPSGARLNDINATMRTPLLCECDGKAVAATFTAAVLANDD